MHLLGIFTCILICILHPFDRVPLSHAVMEITLPSNSTMEQLQPEQISPEESIHVTIVDDHHGDSTSSRPSDSGHERLIQKQPSTDGRSIPHCRASKPPNYLGFAIIVSDLFFSV